MNVYDIAAMILEDARKLRIDAERLRRCEKQEDATMILQGIAASVQALALKYGQWNGSSVREPQTRTRYYQSTRSKPHQTGFLHNALQWQRNQEQVQPGEQKQQEHKPTGHEPVKHQWK